ncbi:hypothetical protein F5Y02DRAFT_165297 [Annulohypoxylon stygium]|nr:hypothetical protein F5Y02DRAFT_165297 [Annulohypoxylon stygium]
MKPQRNQGSRLSQLARLRVSSPMRSDGGLSTRMSRISRISGTSRTRVLVPPHISAGLPLLRSSSAPSHVIIDEPDLDLVGAGRRTLIKDSHNHNHNGNNTKDYTITIRDSNQQTHHHDHPHHPPEPSSLHSLHSGLFSCSTTGSGIRKREPSSITPITPTPTHSPSPLPPYTLPILPFTLLAPGSSASHSTSHSASSIGQSFIRPPAPSYPINSTSISTSNRCFLILPHRPTPRRPMAFSTYSTASSDISTPRSASPSSSIISARSSQSSVSSKRLSLSLQRRQSALNPMSTVDIAAIEEQMKMAALDGLRGYAQNHYGEVQQYRSTDYVPQSSACGYQVLREPLWNKGIIFCLFFLSIYY